MSAPPWGAGEIVVRWARPASTPALLGLLSAAERARAGRLQQRGDRDRYVSAHALLRLVLAEDVGAPAAGLPIRARCRGCGSDEHGKPVLDGGPHFSLAHAGDRVVVASTSLGPVGVDVEPVPVVSLQDIEGYALSPAERAVVAALPAARRPIARARYWVRKEAVLKCTGDGLAVEPSAIEVSSPDEAAAVLERPGLPAIAVSDVPFGADHLGAVALMSAADRRPRISVANADALLSDPAAWAVPARTARR